MVGVVGVALVGRSLLSELLHAERTRGDVGGLVPNVLTLAALTAGLGVAQAVQQHRQRLLAELCQRQGEEEVLAVTSSVELAAFDEPAFHDAAARAVAGVGRLGILINSLTTLLRSAAVASGAAIALVALQPLLAPLVLLVLAPAWLAARRRGRAFYRFAHGITPRDRERRYLATVLSERDAAKEVRAYGLRSFLRPRHARLWDERLAELRRVAGRERTFTALANVTASLIVSGTLLGLIALVVHHDISVAGAGATATTIILLGGRLASTASGSAGLSESALFLGDYLTFVEHARPEAEARAADEAPPAPVHVRAEGVTFSYAGARGVALRDVSLEIAPGEVVALVGENGSGKTTLAKLLAALYVPQEGRVTWNGTDTATTDRAQLRRDVAVVFQDFLRYALPAWENIALGRYERIPDDDGVGRAARSAGLHEELEGLPDGYETMLGPAFFGGTDLSIGQWQRVALARTLFRDAPFVILDEPTAALDARAERNLFEGIRDLFAGRSVLLISHRFANVRSADRIHVLHHGAIIESGTHDELLAQDGTYAELFQMQATPYR
jgi:ATP-binding cassette subfamily B protein